MILIRNSDIGYFSLPQNDLATEECLTQYITDNPNKIYRLNETVVVLKEGAFKVTIDSWMNVKLISADDLEEEEFNESDFPLPMSCPFCRADEDWADHTKGCCAYCGYYLP